MFGTFLKQSLWVLPWFLIPVACYVFFVIGLDPYYIREYSWAERVTGNHWGRFAEESARVSLIVSLVIHVLLLLIGPSAIGGADPRIKRIQFYAGFFINIALSLCLPLYYFLNFGLDGATFGIMICLQLVMSLATFIIGSRFVSPAYKKAFWFAG